MKIHYRKFVICMISIQSVANDDDEEEGKKSEWNKMAAAIILLHLKFHALFILA